MRKRTGTAKPRAPRKPPAIIVKMQPFEAVTRAAELATKMLFDGALSPKVEMATAWSQTFDASTDFFDMKAGGLAVYVRFQFTFTFQKQHWDLSTVAQLDDKGDRRVKTSVSVTNVDDIIDVRSLLTSRQAADLAAAQMKFARGQQVNPDADIPF